MLSQDEKLSFEKNGYLVLKNAGFHIKTPLSRILENLPKISLRFIGSELH
jgi:hypothetical protein